RRGPSFANARPARAARRATRRIAGRAARADRTRGTGIHADPGAEQPAAATPACRTEAGRERDRVAPRPSRGPALRTPPPRAAGRNRHLARRARGLAQTAAARRTDGADRRLRPARDRATLGTPLPRHVHSAPFVGR